MNMLNGLQVIENKLLVKGTRQRKTHKCKRINKKWRKKYGFIDIPDKNLYRVDNYIVGHPITIRKLIKIINKKEGD